MNEQEETRNIIWIEPKLKTDEEYDSYLNQLKAVGKYIIKYFYDVDNGLNTLFGIEFEESTLIVSGELIKEFYTKLINKGIKNLLLIPKLFIFSSPEKIKEISSDSKYIGLPFFNKNYLFSQFDQILEELKINHILELFSRNEKFIFQSINDKNELIFPINFPLFSSRPSDNEIKRFNNFIHEKYKDSKIEYLLSQTLSTKVPLELLIKYWLRLYSFDEFSKELNDNLRSEIGNAFDVYVRFIYFCLKEGKIEPSSNKNYYRGGKISNYEIEYITKLLKNKKENLPACICYSKIFLTFSIDEKIALELMHLNKNKLQKNETLVLLEIEKGENELDKKKSTNVNLEKISKFPERKEVLFFPFSCFEVSEIKNEFKFKYNYIRIKLKYLGKYQKLIPETKEKWEMIQNRAFTKDFTHSILCDQNELLQISEKNPELILNCIIAKYRIGKDNLNKDIQIINCDKDKKRIEELEKLCDINLNGEKIKFSLTHKFDKEGEYKFKFVFNNHLTNCSYLFNQCSTLFYVDLRNFQMDNITDLSYMFSQCESLTDLDLSKLIGKNVENMSFMFNGCNKLKNLNLHHFQPEKKIDCRSLFSKCSNLNNIDLTLFKIKGSIKSEKMFEGISKTCKINSNDQKIFIIFKDQIKK